MSEGSQQFAGHISDPDVRHGTISDLVRADSDDEPGAPEPVTHTEQVKSVTSENLPSTTEPIEEAAIAFRALDPRGDK